MIYVHVQLKVKDAEEIAKVSNLLKEHGGLSRSEPGCARFDVYHSKSDPHLFLLVEHWESEAHLDEHRLAPGYTTIYKPQVIPLVDRVPNICDLIA